MPPKTKKANFEAALTELETIVDSMEDGDLSLDEALKSFERGVKLTRECQKALETAEQKVTQLTRNDEGDPLETPFNLND